MKELVQVWEKLFTGKTIKSVDVRGVNYVVFYFKDGTKAGVEVETFFAGLAGMVPQEKVDE